MRLLLLSPARFAEGGAERSARLVVDHLVREGHRIRVLGIAGSALRAFSDVGAETCVLPRLTPDSSTLRHNSGGAFLAQSLRSTPAVLRAIGALTNSVLSFKPDIVLSNGARTHMLSLTAPTSVPIVWALRDVPPSRLQTALLRYASRRATLLIANSVFTQGYYGLSCRKTVVVGNPVSPVVPHSRQSARRLLSLPFDRHVVAIVAHLHPSKGHHVALAALAQWSPDKRPFLAIAGGAHYPGSEQYRKRLDELISELGLRQDVAFLGNLSEIDRLYGASDMLVHCALHPEGFGRTVVEAQTAGLPVVASNLGGIAELCRDRFDALLVPANDAEALHHAVDEVLTSESLRASLAAGGHERAAEFAPDRHVKKVELLLLELVRS